MKFGKLLDISQVDFALPEDHPDTLRILGDCGPAAQPRAYLGATGWGNREWVGEWYPTRTKQADYLIPYAKQFGTLEFNSTHYRIPNLGQVEKWYANAASDFLFCPKVPQVISHYQRLQGAPDATEEFLHNIRAFKEKLGPVFMQMPDNYGPEQGPHFKR